VQTVSSVQGVFRTRGGKIKMSDKLPTTPPPRQKLYWEGPVIYFLTARPSSALLKTTSISRLHNRPCSTSRCIFGRRL